MKNFGIGEPNNTWRAKVVQDATRWERTRPRVPFAAPRREVLAI